MVKPNVSSYLTDKSSVIPSTDGNILLKSDKGSKTTNINSRFSFIYFYEDLKLPELYYVVSNLAFQSSKNRLPRGVLGKINRLRK